MSDQRANYLQEKIQHIDITRYDVMDLIEAMRNMAFSARELARASEIYVQMLSDANCSVILTLAGSLFSAGLKKVVFDMIKNDMVDAIVSTGAVIVDQDFFEALGFNHYKGRHHNVDDNELRDLHIDRIYDTFIDEEELRICDETTRKIADSLGPRPYSSREFIEEMGKYLAQHAANRESVILAAYEKSVPIFVPAFSDCSAGFGMVSHQWNNPDNHMSLDSAKDFLELTKIKMAAQETGIFMIGGGVPKNFVQDIVICAGMLGRHVPMHKYAIQITVADVRDGALSSSTLKEASSWGKVDTAYEQMVYSEATIAMPLIVSYAYHKGVWKTRKPKNYLALLDNSKTEAKGGKK